MRIIVALLCVITLSACTAEQAKKLFNNLGSGVALVRAPDHIYSVKLWKGNQNQVDHVQRLNIPYSDKHRVSMALSPDVAATNALVVTSSEQIPGPDMEVYIGIYDPRNGVARYLRQNKTILTDVFGSKPPTTFEMWMTERACWHDDDTFIIGLAYIPGGGESSQTRLYVKYDLKKVNGRMNIVFADKRYAGVSQFPTTAPAGYSCKDHPLYDATRFDVQNGIFKVDSTPANQPVNLQPVAGFSHNSTAATAVLFK